MDYIVKEVADKKGWKDFLSIPEGIYKDDSNWVAPESSEVRRTLDSKANPYFTNASLHLFVCYCDEKPVSRAILVVNKLHWERWGKKSAFFGFFESINDPEAVKLLFRKIEDVSQSLGAEYLEGPFNPNHYSELGILIDNFSEEPLFFEPYNPPYYSHLLEEAGFSELKRIDTRINKNISVALLENLKRPVPELARKDIRIRKFNIWKLHRDLELMREINNDAFEDNWYFLPLAKKEYSFIAKYLFFLTYPSHILFAEYKGKAVAVTEFALNINRLLKPYHGKIRPWDFLVLLWKRRKIKELIIFTSAIKKSARHTWVAKVMMYSMIDVIKKYPIVATSWVSDDNKSVIHTTDLFGMKPHKYFVIYSKTLSIQP